MQNNLKVTLNNYNGIKIYRNKSEIKKVFIFKQPKTNSKQYKRDLICKKKYNIDPQTT